MLCLNECPEDFFSPVKPISLLSVPEFDSIPSQGRSKSPDEFLSQPYFSTDDVDLSLESAADASLLTS